MNGFKIIFDGEKSEIDLTTEVVGFDAVVQNSLMNANVALGSDIAFPERGTRLFAQALQGGLSNRQTAQHAASFAAVDALFFTNETDDSEEPDRLGEFILQVIDSVGQHLRMRAQLTSRSGKIAGTLLSI